METLIENSHAIEKESGEESPHSKWISAVEVALIVGLFYLYASSPPPNVNEAHYLGKAKHYWNPEWGQGDIFLESADAHGVFFWTFGWTTLWLTLPQAAWLGRFLTWLLLAIVWRRLSGAVCAAPGSAVLSAALFLTFSYYGHMAGEWVVGGVEAKGFAYALAWLAVWAMSQGRWKLVWPLLGVASSFHVLVGGWSVLAAAIAWLLLWRDRPSLRSMLPSLVFGAVLSLPGLLPAVLLTRGADPADVALANQIYVFARLPHHLVLHKFAPELIRQHGVLLAGWIVVLAGLWKFGGLNAALRRISAFVAGAMVIATAGGLIDALIEDPATAAGLLRFYWFRLSDAMLPVGAALTATAALSALVRWSAKWGWAAVAIVIISAGGALYTPMALQWQDPRSGSDRQTLPEFPRHPWATQQAAEDWLRACRWIAENTPPDARVLTPRRQQTFKWHTGRPETATWKDVPQDAAAVVHWWRQFRLLHRFPPRWGGVTAYSDEALAELARRYDFQYILVDRHAARRRLGFEKVYPTGEHSNRFYEVFKAP